MKVHHATENDYVLKRLEKALAALRTNKDLQGEFIRFAVLRGGDGMTLPQRLRAALKGDRAPQGFLALALEEFTRKIPAAPAKVAGAQTKSRKRR